MELNQTSVSNTRNTNGNGNTSLAIMPMADKLALAKHIVESRMFGFKNVAEVVTLSAVAEAQGKHPATVCMEYHVIQGRPALKADAMLDRFQRAGGTIQWTERTDKACSAKFTHPQGGSLEVRWTLDDAKRAGLLGGKSNWTQYPRQMLSARVVSEGVRAVFPGVLGGFYTPEEVSQFEPAKAQPNYEPAPRLTDVPEVIEADAVLVDPPMPEPAPRASKPAPIRKPQPVAQPLQAADYETVTLKRVARKTGTSAKGKDWTRWGALIDRNGNDVWVNTFDAQFGELLDGAGEGAVLLMELKDGERGTDIVDVRLGDVPEKSDTGADSSEELDGSDEIPF